LFASATRSFGPTNPGSIVPPAVAKAIALFAVLVLGTILVISPSHAATKASAKSDPVQTLSDAFEKLAAKGTAGLEAADALASAIDPETNQMVDPIAHACFPARIKFIGGLPKPSTTPQVDIFVIYERARIARLTLQKGLPAYLQLGCAPLTQNEANFWAALLGIAGISVGTAGLASGAARHFAGADDLEVTTKRLRRY
jgi:hypothetical protein